MRWEPKPMDKNRYIYIYVLGGKNVLKYGLVWNLNDPCSDVFYRVFRRQNRRTMTSERIFSGRNANEGSCKYALSMCKYEQHWFFCPHGNEAESSQLVYTTWVLSVG